MKSARVPWPGPVAGHAAVGAGFVNLRSPGLHFVVVRHIKAIALHGVHIGAVAKEWPNVGAETEGNGTSAVNYSQFARGGGVIDRQTGILELVENAGKHGQPKWRI